MKFRTLDVVERLKALVPEHAALQLGNVHEARKTILDAIEEIRLLSDEDDEE